MSLISAILSAQPSSPQREGQHREGSIEVGGRFPALFGGTDCDLAAGEVSP
jgi:hypothetical protein